MRFFLTAKHWVLFMLMFGIPTFIYICGMIFTLITDNILGIAITFPIIMTFSSGMLFGWLWSVGNGLYLKVPARTSLNNQRFRSLLFFVIVYMLILLISFYLMFIFGINSPFTLIQGFGLLIFIPVHLFSMFCLFYAIYYDAKTIRSIELQKDVSFSDFAVEFILFWFWPVGIWILQPRINKIAAPI